MRAKRVTLVVVVLGIAVTVVAFLIAGWQDCKDRGGAYVRGVFGPQCVERAR